MQGVLWAAAAGVSFGLFQAINRRASRDIDNYVATVALLVTSVIVLGGITLLTQDLGLLAAAPLSALGWFAFAGAIHFFIGWTCLGLSQRRIGAARTGVILGTTPLFGAAIAFLILGEVVRATAYAGVALVVAGILLLSLSRVSASDDQKAKGGFALVYGFTTAVCWGLSPIFIRFGLQQLPSPLIGVTVGMAAATAAYGVALLVRGLPDEGGITRGAVGWLVVAGVLVAAGIAAQWIALDLAPVAIVVAVSQVSLPVVLLAAPLIVGGETEELTVSNVTGGLLVFMGTLLIIFSRGEPT